MISQTRAERYARAKEIFFAVLELDAARRDEFVLMNCGDNADLRREVERLLAARGKASDFLAAPAFAANLSDENLTDKIVDGYRLRREIGAGGMGVVYLAEKTDGEFKRQVALKLVKNNLFSKTIFKRFNLERQILSRLEHPNIAHLIDGGATDDGTPYFVMEYVEGVSLIKYAESENLSLAARLELFRQVCAAVSFAHRHGVIHRDLKPSNILVTTGGTVKLLDFGVAKLLASDTAPAVETATTFRAMTPEYAAPEQIRGEAVTTVTDVYSLGVVLYRLLTGKNPYRIDSENLNEIIRAVCEISPVRPSAAIFNSEETKFSPTAAKSKTYHPKLLRGDLDNIVLKAMRKEPARRYSSVEALSEDLRRHLAGLPVTARRDTFAYRAEKFIRRNRLAAALSALVFLALLGGIAATVWQARRAERERERAERRFKDVRTLANSFMFELNDEILKGQTQGRELVVRRALEYLDNLAAEAQNDASLQKELAIAYVKIGDIQGKPYSPNLGETDGAFKSYGKALTILESLHQADPANPEIQSELATAYLNLGSIQVFRSFKNEEALENLRKSQALGEALTVAEPQNAGYRRLLADVYKSFGDALKDRAERFEMYRRALDWRKALPAAEANNPADRAAVASLHQRIGMQLEHQGDVAKIGGDERAAMDNYRAALENYDGALAIYKLLLMIEPGDSRHRRNVADLTAMRIPALANLGERAAALKSYETSLAIFEELSAADPQNAEARLDLALTHQIMCRTLFGVLDDFDSAVKSCRRGLQVGKAISTADPKNAEARFYICNTYGLIAEALKKSGNIGGAIENRRQTLEVFEKWLAIAPENAFAAHSAAETRKEIVELSMMKMADVKTPGAKKAKNRRAGILKTPRRRTDTPPTDISATIK